MNFIDGNITITRCYSLVFLCSSPTEKDLKCHTRTLKHIGYYYMFLTVNIKILGENVFLVNLWGCCWIIFCECLSLDIEQEV